MEKINTFLQISLGLLAVIGALFFVWNTYRPNVELSIISIYSTLDKENKLIMLLKIRSEASSGISINDVEVSLITKEDEERKFTQTMYRWKGFLPKMWDANRVQSHYKMLIPASPQLSTEGIKAGVNESYMWLKSVEAVDPSTEIKSFKFLVNGKPNLTIAPPFNVIKIRQNIQYPESKDLYFDDSLFQKISEQEMFQIFNSL